MKNRKVQTIIIAVTVVFIIVSVLLMFGGNLFEKKSDIRKTDSTVMPAATDTTVEIKEKIVVQQDFINTTDTISKVGIVFTRNVYRTGIPITLELLEGNDVLASVTMDVSAVEDQHRTYIIPSAPLKGMKNKKLTIRITPSGKEDSGLMIMMNDEEKTTFNFGGKTIKGTLCFSVTE